MARNYFDPEGRAVTAKPFTFAGKRYERGDEFPHKELNVHATELRGLWLADLVEFPPASAPMRVGPRIERKGKQPAAE